MKYGNKKVMVDGIAFDSKKESNRYLDLKLLQRAGVIDKLELQKEFILIPAQYIDKKCVERPCKYKADFYYYDKERRAFVCEDTKGFKTKDYIIKRKLMLYTFGIQIKEI